ncbi:CD3324 family protein [Paenibacillus chitinolyticus]|uniref:CD3324 family protein n=1 Tax=Paenibacillus chitinolyticus TaxID=79263 RepID=UPI00366E2636
MKYISASEILPEDLIHQIQKYIQGKTLYIPAPKGYRKKWGKDSRQREFLQKRNAEIRQLFQQGENLDRLLCCRDEHEQQRKRHEDGNGNEQHRCGHGEHADQCGSAGY